MPRGKKRDGPDPEIVAMVSRRYRISLEVEVDDELKEETDTKELSDEDHIILELRNCEFLAAQDIVITPMLESEIQPNFPLLDPPA